ncbi:MAG: LamG-like jellyroll fold domain-containing protein [Bacteroidia bacterium]
MKKTTFLLFLLFSTIITQAQVDTTYWAVDNLSQIGGNSIQIIGEPTVIQTELGPAIEFDGIDDGIIVDANPLAGATAFTVEIIFKPYTGGGIEQRFLHLQQDDNNRMLIELRNNNDTSWTLDTFIKSGSSSKALLDYSFVHNLDEWSHAALVFQNDTMVHYVNGVKELEGEVDYQVVNSGQTSLGVRMNLVSWFKGAIHSVRVTHDALSPEDFIQMGVISSLEDKDSDLFISHISPHPIVSEGRLAYELSTASDVTVSMFDLQGKEVAQLFEGFQRAGSHELIINRGKLNAGIYFVVVESGDHRSVRKCLVTD